MDEDRRAFAAKACRVTPTKVEYRASRCCWRPGHDDLTHPDLGPVGVHAPPAPGGCSGGPRLPMPEISRSFMQAPDRALPDLDLTAASMGKGMPSAALE